MRRALGGAGVEGGGGGGGVVGLRRALLRVLAEQGGEPMAGFRRGDGKGGGRRPRRLLLPFGQALPQPHRHAVRFRRRLAERGEHGGRPAPAHRPHPGGEAGGVAVRGQVPPGGEPRQQRLGNVRQGGGGGVQAGRHRHVQSAGEAGGGRRRGAGRQHEGKQFQQVEHRDRRVAEPAQRRRGVDHQGGRAVQMSGDLAGGDAQELALPGHQHGAAVAGGQRGRLRQSGHDGLV